MNTQKEYIGTYKVIKFFRVSRRKQILKRDLTREEAINFVSKIEPTKNNFVGFDKQFTADKYYI
jgi:hypothetical protein